MRGGKNISCHQLVQDEGPWPSVKCERKHKWLDSWLLMVEVHWHSLILIYCDGTDMDVLIHWCFAAYLLSVCWLPIATPCYCQLLRSGLQLQMLYVYYCHCAKLIYVSHYESPTYFQNLTGSKSMKKITSHRDIAKVWDIGPLIESSILVIMVFITVASQIIFTVECLSTLSNRLLANEVWWK